jgi:uncharacterized membrane protein YfcA
MTESLWLIVPISILLGFLSGLGTGGGSLLVLFLTLGLNMDPIEARTINLLFFLPAALIACLFRWKQNKLDFKKVLPAIITGCIFAGIFYFISTVMDTAILKKLFGGLLLFTGVRELFYRPRNAK